MRVIFYGMLPFLFCGLAGCGGNANIVGSWEAEHAPGLIMEFTSDGKMFMTIPGSTEKHEIGTYEVEGNKLTQTRKMAFTGEVQTTVSTIKKVTDTELILETSEATVRWKRK
jgi:uncharacterized protein (TIGR03066 family)